MKTKKFLSALLALVMVLTIAPMAAFAAEEEHTHDETCGCSSTFSLAACSHTNYSVTLGNSRIEPYYVGGVISASRHYLKVYEVYTCTDCGYRYESLSSSSLTSHNFVKGAFLYSYEEQGETVNVHRVTCACGYVGELGYT